MFFLDIFFFKKSFLDNFLAFFFLHIFLLLIPLFFLDNILLSSDILLDNFLWHSSYISNFSDVLLDNFFVAFFFHLTSPFLISFLDNPFLMFLLRILYISFSDILLDNFSFFFTSLLLIFFLDNFCGILLTSPFLIFFLDYFLWHSSYISFSLFF
ncbi:unnamed protein product [Acanthosepion pharaonis]|uniref:Uncharacterized protein n=1 Tax=Acanthosepion pharaonis TaxID=158019 RepID=A0A812BRD7_ACAPH|nr:unnamed protein product [Sepia pharaonis]